MHDMLCSNWLVDFLGFETEFQSISGRLICDIEAVHCVSYPFFVISGSYMVCLSSRGSYQTSRMCWTHQFCLRKLVYTVVSLYAEVGQKWFIKQCRPNQTAHTEAV